MAFPIQQSVIDFHKKFGHPVRDTPQTISKTETRQAFSFIEEEVNELWEAAGLDDGCGIEGCCKPTDDAGEADLVETADALGDIVFTAYGMAARMGIDLDRVLAAICESNMTKEANGMGKIRKGDAYVPPKISEALGL
jgi:predicted HAD superfamily Cof-like phosphohydrolase